jgi:hypothetical protein
MDAAYRTPALPSAIKVIDMLSLDIPKIVKRQLLSHELRDPDFKLLKSVASSARL